LVFATSPTLVTPALGTPTSGALNNCTGLPLSTGVTGQLSLANGGTGASLADPNADRVMFWDDSAGQVTWLTMGANLTIVGTTLNASGGGGGSDLTIGATLVNSGNNGYILFDNGGVLGEYSITGTGNAVLNNSPTLVTPDLGTPSALTLTNATGLPISTGVSGLGTGVATFLATPSSANLATAVTDETGSGALVFATSPTLVTPLLGTPTSGTLTNCTGLPVASGISGLGTGIATFLATPSSANLAAAVTDETGSGALVFATSPALVTPALGTPSSGTLTSCTGLPIATGVSGLGTGIATFLATPSSANLAAAVTNETGSGALVFATSPTLVTPVLGTPTSGTLTNCTGLPIAGLVSSTSTALGVGSLEVGAASDTTLSRDSAGVLACEGSVMYQRNNIVGSVSQSGGTPTGAVIETGSNANGRYTRFADGTQICASVAVASGTMSTASGALFIAGGAASWTFPAAFAATPAVAFWTVRTSGTGIVLPAAISSSLTASVASCRPAAAVTGAECDCYGVAVGRWY
jgi:hypothetical protein